MEVVYKVVPPDSADLHSLIEQLDMDLAARYPSEEIHVVDFHDPSVRDITFVVAYLGEKAVACGAPRPLDKESTELKRFFVDSGYRKRGIASGLLTHLEAKAVELGYKIVKLEAGAEQPEALALYTKFGYDPIEPFGEYVGCKSSLCFEKRL
ncbi:GNAT family N-acetyltransferase [Paenibacillus hexagrammi]|uniref:GNAT family N-acetyltransferase n=1 Tax=Paenibacillus hexagrammi TaxID=2908839 RepID=A0ABY3SS51_9BACL|nr:GNAT family N-acetyltransferase [Paenibacillus sp. YPD9-1]UJF35836.1 GNAT family N-acetyltransferase [Paenibacillus sp. YPD9-1]